MKWKYFCQISLSLFV